MKKGDKAVVITENFEENEHYFRKGEIVIFDEYYQENDSYNFYSEMYDSFIQVLKEKDFQWLKSW